MDPEPSTTSSFLLAWARILSSSTIWTWKEKKQNHFHKSLPPTHWTCLKKTFCKVVTPKVHPDSPGSGLRLEYQWSALGSSVTTTPRARTEAPNSLSSCFTTKVFSVMGQGCLSRGVGHPLKKNPTKKRLRTPPEPCANLPGGKRRGCRRPRRRSGPSWRGRPRRPSRWWWWWWWWFFLLSSSTLTD